MRQLMLEALTWRYYRIRKLANFRCVALDDEQCCASAEYDYEGRRLHVFTTHADYFRLSEAARTLFPMIAEVPAEHDILIDFYVFHSGRLGDPESTEQEVRTVLNQTGFARSIRRIVVTVAGPGPAGAWLARSISTTGPAGTRAETRMKKRSSTAGSTHDGQTAASLAAEQFQD
jgi:hypothetical protein